MDMKLKLVGCLANGFKADLTELVTFTCQHMKQDIVI
jgi:hypothetical protein